MRKITICTDGECSIVMLTISHFVTSIFHPIRLISHVHLNTHVRVFVQVLDKTLIFPCLKLIETVILCVGGFHHPVWLQLVLVLFGHYFSTFYTKCLAKITDECSVPKMRIWSISLIQSE